MVSTVESHRRLEGVFPIVTTPFDENDRLDLESLTKVVGHILDGGAHGVVYPAIASEFQTLTERERKSAIEHVFHVVGSRRPVVVGISCTNDLMKPEGLARHAAECRAAAVMLMPSPAEKQNVRQLFENVAAACDLPIILQNAPPPLGSALSVDEMVEIGRVVPAVRYVKEETLPCGQRISRLLSEATDFLGVFGGAGGRFVLDELARGALGSMPACEFTAIHVEIFNLFRHGRQAEARHLFNALLPLLNFESVFRTPATKHILQEMKVISSSRFRDHNPKLDTYDRKEIAAILMDLRSCIDTLAPTQLEQSR
jgi:4-hydroxy-tetrahydrodipicolinate synthase